MNGYVTEEGKVDQEELSKILNSRENQQETRPSLPEIYEMAISLIEGSKRVSEQSHSILSTLIGEKPSVSQKREKPDSNEGGALGMITIALLTAIYEINMVSSHLSEIKKVVG